MIKKMTATKMARALLLGLSSYCTFTLVYADMPLTSCQSVCTHTPEQYKSKMPMPSGAHCRRVNKDIIYYRVQGEKKPSVIFSSGTGFPADAWYQTGIATQLAEKVSVFSYDRTFTFNSCPNENHYSPITAQDVVDQLRQLLNQEGITPPYILVGQSFGGLYMLLYAKEYPNEVAGLVLMDATPDSGPTPLTEPIKKILQEFGNPQNPSPDNPLYNEMIGQLPSYFQMQKAPELLKNMPLIVMYATKHCLPSAWTQNQSICMTPDQEERHKNEQVKIYNLSNVHKLIRVDGDHMSFFDPDKNKIVMDALSSMLEMSKERLKTLKTQPS